MLLHKPLHGLHYLGVLTEELAHVLVRGEQHVRLFPAIPIAHRSGGMTADDLPNIALNWRVLRRLNPGVPEFVEHAVNLVLGEESTEPFGCFVTGPQLGI